MFRDIRVTDQRPPSSRSRFVLSFCWSHADQLPKMSNAYVVGHITVKNPEMWAEYRSKVPETLAPWKSELVFCGKQVAALSGENPHPDIVVIRFPSVAAVNSWFSSPAYQSLIPLRQQAAEMVLLSYEA